MDDTQVNPQAHPERKLNPPFRWDANKMTKVEISALKVLDTERCLRIELLTPTHGGERLVQGIDVPFMPTAMHADCISVKNHEHKVERAVTDAVLNATASADARADAAEARVKEVEAEMEELAEAAGEKSRADGERMAALVEDNERLRRQAAAALAVVNAAVDIDKLNLLFLHRPAFAHNLRSKIKLL